MLATPVADRRRWLARVFLRLAVGLTLSLFGLYYAFATDTCLGEPLPYLCRGANINQLIAAHAAVQFAIVTVGVIPERRAAQGVTMKRLAIVESALIGLALVAFVVGGFIAEAWTP